MGRAMRGVPGLSAKTATVPVLEALLVQGSQGRGNRHEGVCSWKELGKSSDNMNLQPAREVEGVTGTVSGG